MADINGDPRKLEEYVRPRTPIWLSQLLKIRFEDLPLEELFANCWVLGRVAETIQGLLDGVPYHSPSPQYGDRPPRAVTADIERFQRICEQLEIPIETRISLEEIASRNAGMKIALCLWDVADACRRRGFYSVPHFVPPDDFSSVHEPKIGLTIPEVAGETVNGVGLPQIKRPLIPKLPLDTSPALAKRRARAAAPSTPQDRKSSKKRDYSSSSSVKKPKEQAPSNLKPSSSIKEEKKPIQNTTPAATASLSDTVPATTTPEAPQSAFGTPIKEDSPTPSAAESDLLTSILSPEKNKPAHSQMLNAIMRAGDEEIERPAEAVRSDLGKPPLPVAITPPAAMPDTRSKRSLGLTAVGGNSTAASNLNTARSNKAVSPGGTIRYVRVVGQNSNGSSGRSARRHRFKFPGIAVVAAVVAVVVALASGGGGDGEKKERRRKKKEEEEEEVVVVRQQTHLLQYEDGAFEQYIATAASKFNQVKDKLMHAGRW